MAKVAAVRRVYREWSKVYDTELNSAIKNEGGKLLSLLAPRRGERILDLGCGTGRYAIPLAKRGTKVTAVDVSEDMMAVAQEKALRAGLKIDFRLADINRRLPFPRGHFDNALTSYVLVNIENLAFTIKEVARVLKRGGTFVISDFNPDINLDLKNFVVVGQLFHHPRLLQSISNVRKFVEWFEAFDKAGFKVERILNLKVGPEIKRCLTKKSYKINKGRYFTVIFKVRKIR